MIFQANITLEEYGLMYRVYQKSVRQTETLRELRKTIALPQFKSSVDESFTIQPGGNEIHTTTFFV